MVSTCYIALGSNRNNPLQQVSQAVEEITALQNCHLKHCSPWYQTVAIGPAGQPDYINGVIEIDTTLQPLELLNALQAIENAHHRVRTERWGARTLDLDILLYGNEQILNKRLAIPHPEIANRNFVLYPLADICPDKVFPDGRTLKQLLENSPSDGMVRLSEFSKH